MTREELQAAMRRAFPEPEGEVAVCWAIDQRRADQRVFAELTELREPTLYFIGNVIVHPRWNDVLERAV